MRYKVYLKLTPGTQQFRQFLRSHGFRTYRRDLTGVSKDNDKDDESGTMHYYECYYDDTKKLPQEVEERIDEEISKGNIIMYQTTITKLSPTF